MRMRWLAALLALTSSTVGAACFDPTVLHTYPASGVEVYFDLQEAVEKDSAILLAAGKAIGEKGETFFTYNVQADQYDPRHSPFVFLNFIDPRKYDAKTFIDRNKDKSKEPGGLAENFVAFYEPDGKGGRRVCRVEGWIRRGAKQPGDWGYMHEWKEPSLVNVPALKALAATYAPKEIYLYLYDDSNRLIEWRTHEFDASKAENGVFRVYPGTRFHECYVRDSAGRLEKFIQDITDRTLSCAKATRENAGFMHYRYDAQGRFVGSLQNMPGNPEKPERPKWFEIYRLRPKPDVYHEAEADSFWGLRYVTGLPQIENVSDSSVPDDQLRAIYRFPEPTPTSVMDGLPTSVKAHRRVRIGPASAGGTVSEMYPPNGGITERIYSRDMGGNVFRHERFNKDGKVYRIINDGIMLGRDGKPLFYKEDMDALDRVLAHPKIKVPRDNVRLRVYEVDATGKEKLVALSWSKAIIPPEPITRADLLKNLYKDAKDAWANRGKPKSKPKPPTEEELHVRYTDPQGRETWRDWDAFLKATGFIEFEKEFYPYGHPMSKEPPFKKPVSKKR